MLSCTCAHAHTYTRACAQGRCAAPSRGHTSPSHATSAPSASGSHSGEGLGDPASRTSGRTPPKSCPRTFRLFSVRAVLVPGLPPHERQDIERDVDFGGSRVWAFSNNVLVSSAARPPLQAATEGHVLRARGSEPEHRRPVPPALSADPSTLRLLMGRLRLQARAGPGPTSSEGPPTPGREQDTRCWAAELLPGRTARPPDTCHPTRLPGARGRGLGHPRHHGHLVLLLLTHRVRPPALVLPQPLPPPQTSPSPQPQRAPVPTHPLLGQGPRRRPPAALGSDSLRAQPRPAGWQLCAHENAQHCLILTPKFASFHLKTSPPPDF